MHHTFCYIDGPVGEKIVLFDILSMACAKVIIEKDEDYLIIPISPNGAATVLGPTLGREKPFLR